MREIHRFATVDSTMRKALELARAGAPAGTVVVAEEQTAGQGRLGRHWHSEKGGGLYATGILRPKLCPASMPVVTLALGLAAADAIRQTTGINCDLRWPNDLLIEDRKCGGILAELHDGALLAGIGINLNQTSFPDEIAQVATSLRLASGLEHRPESLLHAVFDTVDKRVEELVLLGKSPVLDRFAQRSSYVRGRRVVVEDFAGPLHGITDGLDAQGFLQLRMDDGERRLIIAGGVRPE